jgi:hypothetical protein
VITTAMSTVIGAGRARVWRALTEPAEVVRWDERVVGLVEPAAEYPRVGRRVRWRYKLGAIPVVLSECPLEVVPDSRLRCAVALGLFRFDETFQLAREPGDVERTRLTLKLVASNSIPVVGGALDRFAVRRLANEFIDAKLRAVQKWCEATAPDAPPGAPDARREAARGRGAKGRRSGSAMAPRGRSRPRGRRSR